MSGARIALVVDSAYEQELLKGFGQWKCDRFVVETNANEKPLQVHVTSVQDQLFVVQLDSKLDATELAKVVVALQCQRVIVFGSLLASTAALRAVVPTQIGVISSVFSAESESFQDLPRDAVAQIRHLLESKLEIQAVNKLLLLPSSCQTLSQAQQTFLASVSDAVATSSSLQSLAECAKHNIASVYVAVAQSPDAFQQVATALATGLICSDVHNDKIPVQQLILAKYMVPVVPRDQILEDHALAIDASGKIVDLLPQAEALRKYFPKEVSNLSTHVVIPGLVNTHTHSSMTLLRGLADDKPLIEWLTEDIWPAEQKFANADFVREGTAHAIAEMVRGGTTCFNDMYLFPNITCEVGEQVGMRSVVGQILFEFPSGYGSGPDEYLAKARELLNKYKDSELIKLTISPHAPYSVNDANLQRANALSKEFSVPFHTHLHETEAECHDSESLNRNSMSCHLSDQKCRPLANFKRLGLLSERFIAVHATQLTDDEIRDLSEAKSHVVHCPSSNLKLASGVCRVDKLLKEGVNVALGTDGAASNNTLDMFAEMKLAALVAKVASGESTSVPAARALEMATLNGAKALGLSDRIGSLEIGKSADVTAVRVDDIELIPMYCAISHLVYVAGRENVSDVWIGGRRVLRSRKLTTIDERAVKLQVAAWHDKIREYHICLQQEKHKKQQEEALKN